MYRFQSRPIQVRKGLLDTESNRNNLEKRGGAGHGAPAAPRAQHPPLGRYAPTLRATSRLRRLKNRQRWQKSAKVRNRPERARIFANRAPRALGARLSARKLLARAQNSWGPPLRVRRKGGRLVRLAAARWVREKCVAARSTSCAASPPPGRLKRSLLQALSSAGLGIDGALAGARVVALAARLVFLDAALDAQPCLLARRRQRLRYSLLDVRRRQATLGLGGGRVAEGPAPPRCCCAVNAASSCAYSAADGSPFVVAAEAAAGDAGEPCDSS